MFADQIADDEEFRSSIASKSHVVECWFHARIAKKKKKKDYETAMKSIAGKHRCEKSSKSSSFVRDRTMLLTSKKRSRDRDVRVSVFGWIKNGKKNCDDDRQAECMVSLWLRWCDNGDESCAVWYFKTRCVACDIKKEERYGQYFSSILAKIRRSEKNLQMTRNDKPRPVCAFSHKKKKKKTWGCGNYQWPKLLGKYMRGVYSTSLRRGSTMEKLDAV